MSQLISSAKQQINFYVIISTSFPPKDFGFEKYSFIYIKSFFIHSIIKRTIVAFPFKI